jgi:hypothetical protein
MMQSFSKKIAGVINLPNYQENDEGGLEQSRLFI